MGRLPCLGPVGSIRRSGVYSLNRSLTYSQVLHSVSYQAKCIRLARRHRVRHVAGILWLNQS